MASPPIASAADGIRVARAGAGETGDSGTLVGRHWSGRIVESLCAVLFPSDCRICGVPLVRVSRLPVCRQCLDSLRAIADGVCTICGEGLFSPYAAAGAAGESKCGRCRSVEPPFAQAVAYGGCESGLRELIHLLKYNDVRRAANLLGRMLAEAVGTLESDFPARPVALVPVPLHSSKLRQRGFDQAGLIARAAMKFGAARDRLRLCAEVLERTRETASQIGLTGRERRENLRGAWLAAQPELVKGREALVVDDTYTTGASVSECARALRRAGAVKVWVATLARTLKSSVQRVDTRPGMRLRWA